LHPPCIDQSTTSEGHEGEGAEAVAPLRLSRFTPLLPAATRATTLQVGIRAREWAIPAKSPSHAWSAVAHRLGLSHLPLRGQRRN